MILDEFLIRLGAVADTQNVNEFSNGLKGITGIALGVVGAVTALTAGVTAFFGGALSQLDDFNNLASETGQSLEFIQELGYAAQLNGSSVEAAAGTVKGLSQAIGEAAAGMGRGAAAFKNYGLSAKNADGSIKGVDEVLKDVQAKMQGLSEQEQIAMLSKLGIDPSMIQMLRMTSEELGSFYQEAHDLGIITADGADAAGEYNDAVDRMSMVFGALRTNIAVGLAPQLVKLIDRFKEFLIANKELIRDGIGKFVEMLFTTFKAIMRVGTAIFDVIDSTIGWKAGLMAIILVLGLLKKATIAAFIVNPIAWVVAAIVGLFLLIDDFLVYMRGGKSALGDFWKPFVGYIDIVKKDFERFSAVFQKLWTQHGDKVKAVVGEWWRQFKIVFGAVMSIVGSSVKYIYNVFKAVFGLLTGEMDMFDEGWRGAWDAMKEVFVAVFNAIDEIFGGKLSEGINKVTGFVADVTAVFSGISSAIGGAFDAAWQWITNAWDATVGKIEAGVNKVKGFFSSIGQAFGLVNDEVDSAAGNATNQAKNVDASKSMESMSNMINAVAQTPAAVGAAQAQAAGAVNNKTTNATTINADQKVVMNITTSDPKVAGQTAADELKRGQQQSIRNAGGQIKQ